MAAEILLSVEHGNILQTPGDVLALKYAQALYGVDAAVVECLDSAKVEMSRRLPKPGKEAFISTQGAVDADHVLYLGVGSLYTFGYEEIRKFGSRLLSTLAQAESDAQTILSTIHGVGYGLDEREAFDSLIAGFVDAIEQARYPDELQRIRIIERDQRRARRLQVCLDELIPGGRIQTKLAEKKPTQKQEPKPPERSADRLREVGFHSAEKPHVFVAMPFLEEMDDLYHYGIQGAVNAAGFLCERANLASFTGDVMAWIRSRIETAELVIADLSGANPNVYLEVGYAWGCKTPTVLLINDVSALQFDVKGQRCLIYNRIKDLEEALFTELSRLKKATVDTDH